MRNLVVLSCVLTVVGLFAFVTGAARAQFEVIDFEDLQVGDGVLANTPLYNLGDGPNPILEMFVGNDNPDLDGNFLNGNSAFGGSFTIGWDFEEPTNGSATLSVDVDNFGPIGHFNVGFITPAGGLAPRLSVEFIRTLGFGAGPFNNGEGAWSGTEGWDQFSPAHLELTTTWVDGDSTGQPVTFTVTQDSTGMEYTHVDTIEFNAGQMRAFYDRRSGQNIDFDNYSFIGGTPSNPPGTDFTWGSTARFSQPGAWTDAKNWSGPGFSYPGLTLDNGTPPASTPNRQSALFGDAIGSRGRTVFTDISVSLNTIYFDNSLASYAITGLGSVNLLGSTRAINPNPAIHVAADNNHQFQATVNFHANGTVDVANRATLTFNNALNLNGHTLTKTGAGDLVLNNRLSTSGGTFNCSQGSCTGTGTIGGDLNNDGGTISPGNNSEMMTEGNISMVPEASSILLFSLGVAVLLLRPQR